MTHRASVEPPQPATTAPPPSPPPSGNGAIDTLSRLVGVLLVNASSLREQRGLAHCLQCKGTGTVECKGCKGKGVLPSSKVQRHSVRRMVSQLEGMVGIGSPIAHDSNWQMSNRQVARPAGGVGSCWVLMAVPEVPRHGALCVLLLSRRRRQGAPALKWSGQLLSALADARQVHRWVLLAAFAAALLCRGGMAFASSFGDAGFGRRRLFASLSWGILAPITGWVLGSHGMKTNILCYVALGLAAAAPMWLLPVEALAGKASTADTAVSAAEASSAGHVDGSTRASSPAQQKLHESSDSDLLPENGVQARGGSDSEDTADLSQHKSQMGARAGPEEVGQSLLALHEQDHGVDLEGGRLQNIPSGRHVSGGDDWVIPAVSQGLSRSALACLGPTGLAETCSLAEQSDAVVIGPQHEQQSPLAASCSGSEMQPSGCEAVGSSAAVEEGFGRKSRRRSDSGQWAAKPSLVSRGLSSLRQHSVTIALLPGSRKYSLLPLQEPSEGREKWPGGGQPWCVDTPRHAVGRTLSAVGSRSARAAHSMVRSLNTLWAAGNLSGMGLPESAGQPLAPRQLAVAVTAALSGPCRPEERPLLEAGLAEGTTGTHASQLAALTNSSDNEANEVSGIRPERGDALEEVASAPSSSRVDSFGGGHPAGDEVTVLRSPTALLAAVSGSPIVQARPPSARLVVGGSSSLTPAHAPGSELRRRPSSRQVASPGTLWALRERAQQPQHDAAAAGRGPGRPTSAPATLPGLAASSSAHTPRLGHAQPEPIAHIGSHATGSSTWRGIGQQPEDPAVLAFYSLAFLFGLGNGCIGYLMLYLRELGAPGLLLGLCLTANCCGEVPAFYFSGWWLNKLGPQRALNVVVLGFVIRLGSYLLLPHLSSLWWVLAVEVFQGLTFAGAMAAGTATCKRIAAPHLRSTTQASVSRCILDSGSLAVFSSLYFGLGPALSGLAGGYMYAAWGLRQELNKLLASPEFGRWQHEKASREARWSSLLSYAGVAALCLLLGLALSPAPGRGGRLEGLGPLEPLLVTASNFGQPAVHLREQLSRTCAELGRTKHKLGAAPAESMDLSAKLVTQQTQHEQHGQQQPEQLEPQQQDLEQLIHARPKHKQDTLRQLLSGHPSEEQERRQQPGQEGVAPQNTQSQPQKSCHEQQGSLASGRSSSLDGVRPLADPLPRLTLSELTTPALPEEGTASLPARPVSSRITLLGLLAAAWLGLLCLRTYALLRHLARQSRQLEAQLASAYAAGVDHSGMSASTASQATEAPSGAYQQPARPSSGQEEVSTGESKEHTSSSEKSGAPSSSGSGAADPSAPLTPERRSSPEPAPDSTRKPPPTPSPPARALALPAHALAAGATQQEADHEPGVVAGPSPQTLPAAVPAAQWEAALAAGRALAPSAQGSEAQAQAGATAGALDSGGGPQTAPSAPQLEGARVFQHYLAERGAVAVEAAQELLASAQELAQLKAGSSPSAVKGDEGALGDATGEQGHEQAKQQPQPALEGATGQHTSELSRAGQHAQQGLEACLMVAEPPRPRKEQPRTAVKPGEAPAPAAHGTSSDGRQHLKKRQQQHSPQEQEEENGVDMHLWQAAGSSHWERGSAEHSAVGLGSPEGPLGLSSHPVPGTEGGSESADESLDDSPQEPQGGSSWVSEDGRQTPSDPLKQAGGPLGNREHPPKDALVPSLVWLKSMGRSRSTGSERGQRASLGDHRSIRRSNG
ncbi:hypothetical protein N2152v2_000487 [Parachlorella kessleri]